LAYLVDLTNHVAGILRIIKLFEALDFVFAFAVHVLSQPHVAIFTVEGVES